MRVFLQVTVGIIVMLAATVTTAESIGEGGRGGGLHDLTFDMHG